MSSQGTVIRCRKILLFLLKLELQIYPNSRIELDHFLIEIARTVDKNNECGWSEEEITNEAKNWRSALGTYIKTLKGLSDFTQVVTQSNEVLIVVAGTFLGEL
jgi:hypothetical protein